MTGTPGDSYISRPTGDEGSTQVRTAFMGLTSSGKVAVDPTVAARAPGHHPVSTDPAGGAAQRARRPVPERASGRPCRRWPS